MYIKSLLKFIFVFTLLFTTNMAFAEMIKNAGFSGSTIITSSNTPIVGETIRLSMPVYNETKGILTATIKLYEDGKKVAEKPVTLKTGEFSGFSTEWKSTSGPHSFELRLEDTYLQLPKASKTVVVLENRTATALINSQGFVVTDDADLLKEYNIGTENQTLPTDNGIDAYRQDFLYDAEHKINSIRQDISESVKQNAEYEKRLNELRNTLPRADGSLLTPVQYIYAWALSALAYILSNAYLFYGFITLVTFLVLRFIFRKFHHRSHKIYK